MKSFVTYSLTVIAAIVMIAAITACGVDRHHFRIEGQFLNMNHSEFIVYSPDGAINGFDTIHITGGRFGYEIPCEAEGTVVLVMPNFSEMVIFAQPGATVNIKADASQVRNVKIEGTDTNKEYQQWRANTDKLSPPELKKQAENYIRKNPYSIISRWLLRKYFIATADADLKKVKELIPLMQKKGEENMMLSRITDRINALATTQVGDNLPSFTVTDINGKIVKSSDFTSGKAIVILWTTWNYDGQNMHRVIGFSCRKLRKEGKREPKVLSLCIDASLAEAKNTMRNTFRNDSISWPIICDGKMWDSPVVKRLGFNTVPDNILLDNGRIIARHMTVDELQREIEK